MGVLEAPGTSQDEICESCPMRRISDAVVGCSRCICPSDSSKTGAYLRFDTGRSRRRCKVYELRGTDNRWDLNKITYQHTNTTQSPYCLFE
jgi:hypothetical protein